MNSSLENDIRDTVIKPFNYLKTYLFIIVFLLDFYHEF